VKAESATGQQQDYDDDEQDGEHGHLPGLGWVGSRIRAPLRSLAAGEGVGDLVHGVLRRTLGVVGAPFVLQTPVSGHCAGGFLDATLRLIDGQDALEIKAKLAKWLAPRGLAFNEDKTRVVCLDRASISWGATSAATVASC
jgi:hypothetical protein